MGFREPDEPRDDRPVIKRTKFWADHTERATYEAAVEMHPKQAGEGTLDYLTRIIKIATGKLATLPKSLPKVEQEEWDPRLPYKD